MTSQTVLTLWAWWNALTLTAALTILALTRNPADPADHPTWEEQ